MTDSLTKRELAALGLSVALVPLNSTMLAVAIPAIATDLAVPSETLTQALVASYLLVGIVLQSPGGKLGDGIGHVRALRLGQLVFGAGAIVGFVGRAMVPLAIARGMMAAAGAVMVPSAFALVRARVAKERQAAAFGAFGAVMGVAAALGPLLGGEIADRFGWPALFAVNAPPVLLAAAIARSSAREPSRTMPRFDVLGGFLLAVGLVLAVLGARAGAWLVVAAGVAVLVGFFAWERRAANPVIDPALFRRRAFAAGVSVIGLQNLAMYALLFELPIILGRAWRADPAESGRTLMWLTLAMVAGSLGGGRVAGKLGERRCAIAGSVAALAGMVALAFGSPGSPLALAPGLALLGLGIGITTPSVQALAMAAVDRAQAGMAAGVSATSRYLGGVLGVGIVSTLLAGGGDALAAHRLAAHVLAIALALALGAALALP